MIVISKHYALPPTYVSSVHQRLVEYLTKNYGMLFNEKEKIMFGEDFVSKAWGVEVYSTSREAHDNDLVFKFDPKRRPSLNPSSQTLESLFPKFNFSPKPENQYTSPKECLSS